MSLPFRIAWPLAGMMALGVALWERPARAQRPVKPDSKLKAFWASPEDPIPRRRKLSAHYWAGNERELYIYYQDLKNLGGGYVGVGADQCYLFIGWMKTRLAWCVDYDEQVVDVHWIHRTFFLEAATPREYIRLWSRKRRKLAAELLDRDYHGQARLGRIRRVFRKARARIYRRLTRMRRIMKARRTPSFVSTQGQYDAVRKRIRERRVRPMLVNLLEKVGLVGVGRAARKLGVPIRALYLSNAEQYWKRYSATFRANVRSLFYDGASLVLSTYGRSRVKNSYSYYRQSTKDYVAWLGRPSTRNYRRIVRRKVRRRRGVNYYVAGPPMDKRRRRRR